MNETFDINNTLYSSKQFSDTLFSIIIPAFNEEENLRQVLTELNMYANQIQMHREVIVVNDGSTDKTSEVGSNGGARVLSNGTNLGKAYCLKRGFEHAKGEIIITMDGDGSHDPNDIGKLVLPILNGTDIAIGSRFHSTEGKKTTSRVHLFGNYLISLAILLLTGRLISDSQSGFRAYKSMALRQFEIFSKGFAVETELTVKPLMKGFAVEEVPILVRKRINGSSRVRPIRDGFRIINVILQLGLLDRLQR